MMTDLSIDLAAAIRELENQIESSVDQLPEEVFLFISRVTPLVNVDLLIQDDNGRTLLTWRSDRFYGPGWHVPGGVIRYKETAADRIRKVAEQELGVAVQFDASPLLVHESIVSERRNRGHAISLLYKCRLAGDLDCERQYVPEAPISDQWLWHEACPENIIREHLAYAVFMR
jgi:ADP-ribose pyrophosphatase YjhB (NUDIX family)